MSLPALAHGASVAGAAWMGAQPALGPQAPPPTTGLYNETPSWGEVSEVLIKWRHLLSRQTPQTMNEFPRIGKVCLGGSAPQPANVDPPLSATQALCLGLREPRK